MSSSFDPFAVQVPASVAPDMKQIAAEILAQKDKMATRGDWNQRIVDYCDYASQAFSIVSFAEFFAKSPAEIQTAFGLVSPGLSVLNAFEAACNRVNQHTKGNWSSATLHGDPKMYIANPYLKESLEAFPATIPYNTIAYCKRRSRKQTARSLAVLFSIFLRFKTVVDVAVLTTALASLLSTSVKLHKLRKIDVTPAGEDLKREKDIQDRKDLTAALKNVKDTKGKKIFTKIADVFSSGSPHGGGVVYHQGVNIGDIALYTGSGIQIAATAFKQLDKLSAEWGKYFKEAFDPKTIALGSPKNVSTQIYIAAAYIHFRATLEQAAVNARPDVRTSHIPTQSAAEARYLANNSGAGGAFTRHLARTAYGVQHKQQVASAGPGYAGDEKARATAGPATAIFKTVFSSTFGEFGHQYDWMSLINEPAGWLALADKLSL